jgi:hypothetical protein
MLRYAFVPHLLARGLSLQTQRFMQDGVRPHTANGVLDLLHNSLDSLVISNRFPDCSAYEQNWHPDLNQDDNFVRGFFKEKVFPKKQQTLMEMRALIIQTCNEITEDICRRVINLTVGVEGVARRNGGHNEHLIHRG